jgi:hypothetical protein
MNYYGNMTFPQYYFSKKPVFLMVIFDSTITCGNICGKIF